MIEEGHISFEKKVLHPITLIWLGAPYSLKKNSIKAIDVSFLEVEGFRAMSAGFLLATPLWVFGISHSSF